MKRSALALAAIAAAAAGLLPAAMPAAHAADPTTITVTATAAGTLSTQISSNNVYAGMVDQGQAWKTNFANLSLPLVRLHVGDDGGNPAMPEYKTQGQWSFSALDELVNDETSLGQEVVMNIKFAPDWMWTCSSFGQQGQVKDQTFQTFAAYMARLVSYYNKGSMKTESGTTITNPAGTSNHVTYWELWNEPDLSNETPCSPASGQALTPAQYLTMWNAVTAAMLQVDPTIKFIGPATAGGQFGSGTGAGNDYITQIMQNGTTKPYALSFHGYGYWDNAVSDKTIFDGDSSPPPNGGIDDIAASAQQIHDTYPTTPMWITEMNVNAAWSNDPKGRPWGPLSAAWWGSTYIQLAPLNVSLIHQYNICESPQFGLIDDQTGATRLPYWEVKTLNAAFPYNSTLLQTSSPDANIQLIAARRPDGKTAVLVVNRRVDPANPSAGKGLPASLNLSLSGITPGSISLQQLDANTSTTQGPATTALPVSQTVPLSFPGYGMAIVTITPAQAQSAPTISSFTPTSGGDGTSVTINGSNFTGTTGVSFSLTPATSYVVNSDTKITATLPQNVYGPGKIRVTNPAGTGVSSTNFSPTAPFITDFTPASGPNGSTIVVHGFRFTGATSASIYYLPAQFTVNSDTQMTLTVPADIPGPGRIRIQTPNGLATSPAQFVPTAPIVTGFSPASAKPGDVVTVTGQNFSGATDVSLYFVSGSFTVLSDTQLQFTVPDNVPGNGKIRVTTPNGMGGSQTQLVYTGPTITSFTPTSGPAGTTVTLTGKYLTGTTSVTLFFRSATFTVNSATKITVTVPSGVPGPGKFRLTTPNGNATSANQFTPTS